MTKMRSIPIECPECHKEQSFAIYDTINATLDKSLSEKLLSRELCTFTCDNCQTQHPVHYPLLYHDMDRSFMIWLRDSDVAEELQAPMFQQLFDRPDSTYRFRLVSQLNALLEKIGIFQAGLDDRIVELNKLMVMFQLREQQIDIDAVRLYFTELSDNEEMLCFIMLQQGQQEPSMLQFPMVAYDDVQKRLQPHLPADGTSPEFLRIDWEYAHALMTQHEDAFA